MKETCSWTSPVAKQAHGKQRVKIIMKIISLSRHPGFRCLQGRKFFISVCHHTHGCEHSHSPNRAVLIFPGDGVWGRWMRASSSKQDGAAEGAAAENCVLRGVIMPSSSSCPQSVLLCLFQTTLSLNSSSCLPWTLSFISCLTYNPVLQNIFCFSLVLSFNSSFSQKILFPHQMTFSWKLYTESHI